MVTDPAVDANRDGLTQLTGEAEATAISPAATEEEVAHEEGGRDSSQELI